MHICIGAKGELTDSRCRQTCRNVLLQVEYTSENWPYGSIRDSKECNSMELESARRAHGRPMRRRVTLEEMEASETYNAIGGV